MAPPQKTPNPGTRTDPNRSSRRVAHKAPLGWLPWARLGLLLLVLVIVGVLLSVADTANSSLASLRPTAGTVATSTPDPLHLTQETS